MRVRKLIKTLRECGDERLHIIAVDGQKREFCLEWTFMDDGPTWEEFAFVIKDGGWPSLDTAMAKMLLEYAYQDPDRHKHLFGDETPLEDYRLSVTWPCDRDYKGCGWQRAYVNKIKFREKDGKRQLLLVVDELPPWKDEGYNQEAVNTKDKMLKQKVRECYERMEAEIEAWKKEQEETKGE